MKATEREIRRAIREAITARRGLLREAVEKVELDRPNSDFYVTYDTDKKLFTIQNKTDVSFAAFRKKFSNVSDGGPSVSEIIVFKENAKLNKDDYFELDGEDEGKILYSVDLFPEVPAPGSQQSYVDLMFVDFLKKIGVYSDDTAAASSAPKPSPQAAAQDADIEGKVKRGKAAIERGYEDQDRVTKSEVVGQNPAPAGHVWVESDEAVTYKLSPWEGGSTGDTGYKYLALVKLNEDPNKFHEPVLFVVLTDEAKDSHRSAGQFLSIDSPGRANRAGFCVLYKRATGKAHERCNEVGGGKRGGAGGAGAGGEGAGSGGGEGSQGSGQGSAVGAGAISMKTRDGAAVKGKGDAMEFLRFFLRPGEKLSNGGRTIKSLAKPASGFETFPPGPERMFIRVGSKGVNLRPRKVIVTFNDPVSIKVDKNGLNPRISFGQNTKDDITQIVCDWRGIRSDVTLSPGDDGFNEAADWIMSNQREFDLAPDEQQRANDAVGAGVSRVERSGQVLREGSVRLTFDRFIR